MHKKPFEIIFEDDGLLIVNKIAKILIERSDPNEKNTLTRLIAVALNKAAYPCHRLDRETTGLIIYAKSPSLQTKIMEEFRYQRIKKKYIAFVKGILHPSQGHLSGFIIDTEGERFGEKPKLAKTYYSTLKTSRLFSVLELTPSTGRTNQLRIQLAQKKNPILGERKYAFGKDFPVKFKRLALHAYYIGFNHPVTGKIMQFEIDLPDDMRDFLSLQKCELRKKTP